MSQKGAFLPYIRHFTEIFNRFSESHWHFCKKMTFVCKFFQLSGKILKNFKQCLMIFTPWPSLKTPRFLCLPHRYDARRIEPAWSFLPGVSVQTSGRTLRNDRVSPRCACAHGYAAADCSWIVWCRKCTQTWPKTATAALFAIFCNFLLDLNC